MIRLEPFTPADFPQLIEWIDSEQLLSEWSGAMFSYPLTTRALEWYIEGANDFDNPEVFIYKAVDAATGGTVGHISLGGISDTNRSGRITRVLVGHGSARGKGYCPAMIKAMLQIGFAELNLHRIELGVYSFNHAAIRCYRKCGFRTDGVMRDVARHGDEYWSLVEMSILEDEWRALQAAPEQTSDSEKGVG
jgi:RimJ/RimL family protein N-acetyltransferase